MKLKNITVATEKNIGYYTILEESCEKNNIDLIVLGLGHKWTGFTMRLTLWDNYLKTLDENEIIMINDAYDVIIIENSHIILNKFKKLNKKVIFGMSQSKFFTNITFNKCLNSILCCGNIIGYVKYIRQIINLFFKNMHLWETYHKDDQIILNIICNKYNLFKEVVGVDINQDIFFVASTNCYVNLKYYINGNINNLKMSQNKLLNKLDKSISVLHLPGDINGNVYLKYLGYNISNIKIKKFKIYRLYQIYGFSHKYIKFIIFIIIVGYIIYNKKITSK